MQHDTALRAAARAIYDACYPSEDWAPCPFDEAEQFGTVHYRQAVEAAQHARAVLAKGSSPARPLDVGCGLDHQLAGRREVLLAELLQLIGGRLHHGE